MQGSIMPKEHITLQKIARIVLNTEVAISNISDRQQRENLGLHRHSSCIAKTLDEVHNHAIEPIQDNCGGDWAITYAWGRTKVEGKVQAKLQSYNYWGWRGIGEVKVVKRGGGQVDPMSDLYADRSIQLLLEINCVDNLV
jgi:hypothetical protein